MAFLKRVGPLVALLTAAVVLATPAGSAKKANETITLATLPIANALPLDLGIKKGFFDEQGIEIKKNVLQSGNDIVLALANNNADVGYLGYVPMFIARTQGIPLTLISASEVEGTSESDNWQNILVKGSSSIRAPKDLAGKTIAVNALKGVGETMIKAALKKSGVDPDSVKLLALPFPTMRTALNNGQVDAFWAPEPFLTQGLNLDGDRTVMAPGPVLGKFFPVGGYGSLDSWVEKNPALAKKFQTAINKSLSYAQSHPDEIRALLPAGTQNVRLPIWSPLVDRVQLLQLAKYAKEFGIITTLPNFTKLLPASLASGKTLQATLGGSFVTLRLNGQVVRTLPHGKYTIVVNDTSKTRAFTFSGPGVRKRTSVKGTGHSTWTLTLRRGIYVYSASGKQQRGLRVT